MTGWTKAPWNICWTTFDGRKVNFEITASPYGSVRPITGSRWKADWSEVEGDELIANAHLIAAAPAMADALRKARNMLQSVAGDIEDGYSLADLRGKYVLAVLGARDDCDAALALTRGEDPK